MPLGGFAPCPLPLGGSATDGLTAEQHARVAADLKAAVLTAPFAVFAYTFNSAGIYAPAYIAQHGVGVSAAPAVTSGGVGIVNFDWSTSYLDEYDNALAVNIRHAVASPIWTTTFPVAAWCNVTINSPTSLTVYTVDNANAAISSAFSLAVW